MGSCDRSSWDSFLVSPLKTHSCSGYDSDILSSPGAEPAECKHFPLGHKITTRRNEAMRKKNWYPDTFQSWLVVTRLAPCILPWGSHFFMTGLLPNSSYRGWDEERERGEGEGETTAQPQQHSGEMGALRAGQVVTHGYRTVSAVDLTELPLHTSSSSSNSRRTYSLSGETTTPLLTAAWSVWVRSCAGCGVTTGVDVRQGVLDDESKKSFKYGRRCKPDGGGFEMVVGVMWRCVCSHTQIDRIEF